MVFLVITLVAYLAGIASAVFLITIIGIRRGDRPERILNPSSSRTEACARTVLSSGTWPDIPVYRATGEDDQPGHPGFPPAP